MFDDRQSQECFRNVQECAHDENHSSVAPTARAGPCLEREKKVGTITTSGGQTRAWPEIIKKRVVC